MDGLPVYDIDIIWIDEPPFTVDNKLEETIIAMYLDKRAIL